jgi:hypothetical protein
MGLKIYIDSLIIFGIHLRYVGGIIKLLTIPQPLGLEIMA